MSAKPARLQLSRRRGFDLQKLSRTTNGLPAIIVSRPSKWGSPFRLKKESERESLIARYRKYLRAHPELVRVALEELRGKNLACWCKPGLPCHAEVLLRVANSTGPI
ncbi:MAG: DUF4326 domain-containing protein [Alphaproteobacteria bacterium]